MAAGDVEVNLTTPKARRCAIFDGVDDSLDVLHNELLPGTGNWSVSFWAHLASDVSDDTGGFGHWRDDSGSALYYYLNRSTSGNVTRLYIGSEIFLGSDIRGEGWTHIVVLRDGNDFKQYVNGELDAEETKAVEIGNGNFGIGLGSPYYCDGGLTDFRIYDKALSTDEIDDLYAGKNVTDGLKAYWKLQEDYKDTLGNYDATNDGTYLGAIDDQTEAAICNDRTTANDQYLIAEINGKVMTAIVEEAA